MFSTLRGKAILVYKLFFFLVEERLRLVFFLEVFGVFFLDLAFFLVVFFFGFFGFVVDFLVFFFAGASVSLMNQCGLRSLRSLSASSMPSL